MQHFTLYNDHGEVLDQCLATDVLAAHNILINRHAQAYAAETGSPDLGLVLAELQNGDLVVRYTGDLVR